MLDADNYDAALEEFGPMVIEFYAPVRPRSLSATRDTDEVRSHAACVVLSFCDLQWCGHCKKLAPVYAEAAQELAALEPPLYLAKVQQWANQACYDVLCLRFVVYGDAPG